MTKRFLELNLTDDRFHFQVIPGVVPNRGLDPQNDLSLYGLHYLQRVSDADPAPSPLVNKKSIVRMGSVPHGTTVLMQGPSPDSTPKFGKPHIPKLTPFTGYPGVTAGPPPSFPSYTVPPAPAPVPPGPNPPGMGIQPVTLVGGAHFVPEINIALDTLVPPSLSSGPFPAHFQDFIDDPNSVLRHAIRDQDILGHIEIHLTTDTLSADGKPTGGIGSLYETVSNIPFLGVATRTPPPAPATPPTSPAPLAFQAAPVPNAFVYSASPNLLDRMGAQRRWASDTAASGPGSAVRADRGARAVLGAFDTPAASVLAACDPDFQRCALATCDGSDDETERRVSLRDWWKRPVSPAALNIKLVNLAAG